VVLIVTAGGGLVNTEQIAISAVSTIDRVMDMDVWYIVSWVVGVVAGVP
jgi:hypothetical protein